MSLELINSIVRKPWAIDPAYVQSLSPFIGSLLKGTPIHWEKSSYHMPYDLKSNSFSQSEKGTEQNSTIAVISIFGPMLKQDQLCGPIGTATIGNHILEADADSKIEGIILAIDSPGGSVDGTEDLARVIKNTKKPIVAYVDGMMASAAYWAGSAADEIIANGKTAMIGSVGTMIKMADMQPVLEKAGIKFHEVYASKSTDKNKAFSTALKDGDYSLLVNDLLDPLNDIFLSAVQSNRQGKLSTTENTLSGKMYMAAAAKKFGLIDQIGSMDDAVRSIQRLSNDKNKKQMNNEVKFPAISALLGFQAGLGNTEEGIHFTLDQTAVINSALEEFKTTQSENNSLQSLIDSAVFRTQELKLQIQAVQSDRNAWKVKVDVQRENTLYPTRTSEKLPSYLDPENPSNRLADGFRKIKSKTSSSPQ